MRKGLLYVPVEHMAQSITPFMQGTYMSGFPSVASETDRRIRWEEKTGEKKGFLFKRDETRRIAVAGLRCTVCGFIELYAHES